METLVSKDLQPNSTLMINAYRKSDLSLGQLAKALNKTYEETMKLLSTMGVDIIDYDFEDDIKSMNSFFKNESKET